MIDLCPRTPDPIRYCTECTSFSSKLFLPSSKARITDNDKSTELLYSEAYSRINPSLQKIVLQNRFKEFLRLLCECAVSLVKGNFENIKKKDIKKFGGVLKRIISKKTSQKEKKFRLASPKGLQLSNQLTRITIEKFKTQFE